MTPLYESITARRTSEPFGLQLVRGQVSGHIGVRKFGYNGAVTSEEGVWDYGGAINWPSTASVMKVSSSSTSDDVGQSGAESLTISGLDSNWNLATETISLDGQTQATTTTSFIRVHRAVCGGGTNVGTIYVYTGTETNGVPDTATSIYTTVGPGDVQTLQAFYSVPAGYKGYILGHHTASDAPAVTITGRFWIRETADGSDPVFALKDLWIIPSGGGTIEFDWSAIPQEVPEKSDIMLTAESSGAAVGVGGGFDVYLVAQP